MLSQIRAFDIRGALDRSRASLGRSRAAFARWRTGRLWRWGCVVVAGLLGGWLGLALGGQV
ncbi:MAG TPA: hypothetical protein K8V84_23375, partial [Nocardiopsis listeri]|nr:hypothetical protein [Nocardiopsis listeri]